MSEIGTFCDAGPRAPVFGPGPIGVGTIAVESLVSYILRLAAYHRISPYMLFSCQIPNLDPHFDDAVAILRRRAHNNVRVRGIVGEKANTEIAWALAKLTGRLAIAETNIFTYRGGADMSRFVRQNHAWCPQCLQNDPVPHERLLWRASLVTACPHHKVGLQSTCPHCGHRVTRLSWNGELYRCRRCDRPLFIGKKMAKEPPPSPRTLAESQAVSDFCQALFDKSIVLAKFNLVEELCAFAERHGFISISQKGKFLRICKSNLSGWLGQKHAISLARFVEICLSLGVTPLQILLKADVQANVVSGSRNRTRSKFWFHRKPRVRLGDNNALAAQLMEVHTQYPTLSIAALARRIGQDQSRIYHSFPALCHSMTSQIREAQRQQRLAKLATLKDEVRNIIKALISEGVRFNAHHIAKRMRSPGWFLDAEFREYVKDALKQLNRTSEGKSDGAPARAA